MYILSGNSLRIGVPVSPKIPGIPGQKRASIHDKQCVQFPNASDDLVIFFRWWSEKASNSA